MDIGIHYSRFPAAPGSTRAATLADTARLADQGGAALFTVMDHYFQMEHYGGPPEPMLEGYTTLGLLAGGHARTSELGLLVTGVTYRHPGLLAKIVTTLDVLSEGRARLGLGAAWYEREHLGLGVPFPADGASASSGSRRRCRSAARCGATTTAPTTARTTSWPRPCACRRRWSGRATSAARR